MQADNRISLNAVRVFCVVARHGSITLAAAELSLTPSAVSHQLKSLETQTGVPLLIRSNNAIALSEAGRRLYEQASVGLGIVQSALSEIGDGDETITVHVSTSLALRWAIPILESFKSKHPGLGIRFQTGKQIGVVTRGAADLSIEYRRPGHYKGPGTLLCPDMCRPLCAPSVLQRLGYRDRSDVTKLPALSCTTDNWDWRLWCEIENIRFGDLRFSDSFDLDDTALRAAVSGLGMTVLSKLIAGADTDAGLLQALPGFEPVELGRYYIVTRIPPSRTMEKLQDWFLDAAAEYRMS